MRSSSSSSSVLQVEKEVLFGGGRRRKFLPSATRSNSDREAAERSCEGAFLRHSKATLSSCDMSRPARRGHRSSEELVNLTPRETTSRRTRTGLRSGRKRWREFLSSNLLLPSMSVGRGDLVGALDSSLLPAWAWCSWQWRRPRRHEHGGVEILQNLKFRNLKEIMQS